VVRLACPRRRFTAGKCASQRALRAQELHAACGSQYQFGKVRCWGKNIFPDQGEWSYANRESRMRVAAWRNVISARCVRKRNSRQDAKIAKGGMQTSKFSCSKFRIFRVPLQSSQIDFFPWRSWRLVWSARRWSRLFSAGVKGRCGVYLVVSVDTDSSKTSLTTSAPSMRNLATDLSDRRFDAR
jgi:hypothetical protein